MVKDNFNFKEIEEKWKKYWDEERIYETDLSKDKIYSVDTPPPTVSGNMHMGHAFSYSQQDFIVRFRRMFSLLEGGSVFYPFGTDDNGLPTERLVERINNVKSKEMSREEFINLCLKTLERETPNFVQAWKDLGVSCDYNVSYSTIDKNVRKISQKYFLDLLRNGEVYSRNFPTLWCPECQTSIAQAELEDEEKESLFSTLRFKVGEEDLFIATTRPELLGACVAVFVNPKDERYKKFVGEKARVPLFNYEVPIIEDESAEMDKGTGVLMVCSYGDKYDVEAVNRHGLEPKIILNSDGTLKIEGYKGLKIKEARKKILEDLKENDLIENQKGITHIVNVHDKCGTEIEFIPTEQWFVKILDKKEELIEQGRKIKWYPDHMRKRYENWVKGLEWDWSVSRDRHFGIPIPVWKCEKCNEVILPKEDELPVDPLSTEKKCSKCGERAKGEEKVLDTWATSSLTPQIASSLIGNKVSIPFSIRPQGHDIIRTWAFYTIVRALLHEKNIPWKNIVISGNVSLGGEKMSKSKGNVIDPIESMKKYGVDALRFWAAGSKLGEDMDYQEKDLVTGLKFVKKFLNASKFVFMNLDGFSKKRPDNLEPLDESFLEELNQTISKASESFLKYDYSLAKMEVEQFFRKKFTDNYIEMVKKRIYNGSNEEKESAQYTLYISLLAVLKMMAPFLPFITEEIYQKHFKDFEKDKSVHLSCWPSKINLGKEDFKGLFNSMVEIVGKIRAQKSVAKKSMNSEIILYLEKENIEKIKPAEKDFLAVMNIKEIKEGSFKVEFL